LSSSDNGNPDPASAYTQKTRSSSLTSGQNITSAETSPQDLKELVEKSAIIFTGKTEKVESRWNKDKTQIYTLVTFTVYEYQKGAREEKTIILKQLGGTVGNITMAVEDAPEYKVGEEALLFVSGAGYIPVLEKASGDFSSSSKNSLISLVKKAVCERR